MWPDGTALAGRLGAEAADHLSFADTAVLIRPDPPMTSAASSTLLLERITINPQQCGGRPCIRGMRIRVIDVLELLAAGETHEQILADYPYLEPDDIAACLLYAARRLDHPHLAA